MAVSKLSVNYGTPAQFNAGSSTVNSLNPATLQQLIANSNPAFGYVLGPLSATALYAQNIQSSLTTVANISTNTCAISAATVNFLKTDSLVTNFNSQVDSLTSTNTTANHVSASTFVADFYFVKNKGAKDKHHVYHGIYNPSVAFYQSTCQEGPRCNATYFTTGRCTFTTSVSCNAIEIYAFHSVDNRRNCITTHNANLHMYILGISSTLHTYNAGDIISNCAGVFAGISFLPAFKNQQAYLYACNGYYRNKLADVLSYIHPVSPNTTYSIYNVTYAAGYASQWNYCDKSFISVREMVSV